MRFLLVSHLALPHIGGVETLVDRELCTLAVNGHSAVLVTSDGGGPGPAPRYPAGIRVERVRAWHGLERRFRLPYPLFAARLIPVLWREVGRADVVHVHGLLFMGSLAALMIAWLRGRPRVLTDHGGIQQFESRVQTVLARVAIETVGRFSALLATRLVAYNLRVLRLLERLGRRPAVFLPNPVDSARFSPPSEPTRQRARRDLGWPPGRVKVLFAGRLTRDKGVGVLLGAHDAAYDLVFCGPGDPAILGPLPRTGVEYLPPRSRDEIAQVYQAADVFVHPATAREAFPVAVQEALACGLPVVTTWDTGYEPYRDLPGLSFCPRDSGALRDAIQRAVGTARPSSDAERAGLAERFPSPSAWLVQLLGADQRTSGRWLASPWVLALAPTLALSIWHRVFFIGLLGFDDAWYQSTAEEPGRGAFRLITRSTLILLYRAALDLAPSRSWAVLGLGAIKTYLLIASVTWLLRREIGTGRALAVAVLAATSALWQLEYTLVLPDSWMTAVSLLCLSSLYGASPPRHVLTGVLFGLAVYTKELAVATALPILATARWGLKAYGALALGAILAVLVLWMTVMAVQGAWWNPIGLNVSSAFAGIEGESPKPLSLKVAQLRGLFQNGTIFGYGLSLFYVVGVVASLAARRWTDAGGRALLLWAAAIWLTYGAAVVATGFFEPRYAIGPQTALAVCGVAGWFKLIETLELSTVTRRALRASLVVLLVVAVTVPGLREHRATFVRSLQALDLERRLADFIDRLPPTTPVFLALDAADPEEAVGPRWTPLRVYIRLLTLSETSPPRQLRRVAYRDRSQSGTAVYLTNVHPELLPDTVSVTFVSPATEALRQGLVARGLTPKRSTEYRGIRKLYVVLPAHLAGAVRPEELSEPIRTHWR